MQPGSGMPAQLKEETKEARGKEAVLLPSEPISILVCILATFNP